MYAGASIEFDFEAEARKRGRPLKSDSKKKDAVSETAVRSCPQTVLILLAFVVALVATVLSIIAFLEQGEDTVRTVGTLDTLGTTGTIAPPEDPEPAVNSELLDGLVSPTWEGVVERDLLRCGSAIGTPGFAFQTSSTGGGRDGEQPTYAGMNADLCAIVAAALDVPWELVETNARTRFESLANGEFELVLGPTRNMQRDVYIESIQSGVEFSSPYYYDGLGFGGLSDFLQCAEKLDFNSSDTCANVRICVISETTHQEVLERLVPDQNLVIVPNTEAVPSLPNRCNVIASERAQLSPRSIELQGYRGEYAVGSQLFSKEPLSIATREGDPTWTDLIEWILQALIYAEETQITSATASRFPTTSLFGARYEDLFQRAIAHRGSKGRIYTLNLQTFLPRLGLNLVNNGTSPLLYHFPFGNLAVTAPEIEIRSPTVQAIRGRGSLNCGISRRLGFAEFNSSNARPWSGFDVDLCRAIAAAIFDGVDHVRYTDLSASERFDALAKGDVDMLSRLTTWTLSRDFEEPTSGKGFTFSNPYFHDGVTMGGIPPFDRCADNLDFLSPECQSLRFCLLPDTTTLTVIQSFFHNNFIITRNTYADMIEGLQTGVCNAIAGGFNDIASESVVGAGYKGPYGVGSNRFSKDPLALVTREGDVVWSDFVRWIFEALMFAEEAGITQARASEMPSTNLFGPLRTRAFSHAVNAVGNYAEIYDRNFGDLVPRGGLNLLNKDNGPQLFSRPGF